MRTSQEMEGLLKRIYLPSVFYFPEELFPNLSLETKQALEAYRFFEDMGILKIDGKVSSIHQVINSLELYRKEVVLESNLFQLLEMKERLKEKTFGFLMGRYLSNVQAWMYAYSWLFENLEKQILQVTETHKSLFEYQKVVLTKHMADLKLHFELHNYSDSTKTEPVNVLLENKKSFPFEESLIDDVVEASAGNKQIEKQKQYKKVNKKVLLTVEEADEYLLKTIFRVKSN